MDKGGLPRRGRRLHAAGPLWQRIPSRTAEGDTVADFMMLIPRLAKKTPSEQETCLSHIHQALAPFGDEVVFADFNFQINILWVSHRTRHGLSLELIAAIQHQVPEARLIANQAEVSLAASRQSWTQRLKQRLLPFFKHTPALSSRK